MWIGLWLFMALIIAIVANTKGRSASRWAIYGLLLPPIAMMHILRSPPAAAAKRERLHREGCAPCPHCAEMIPAEVRICPSCRRDIDPRAE